MLSRCIVLLALALVASAHICLLYPDQRGGANITGPGSHNCYQPQAPCGTKPAQTPKVTLIGGTYNTVLFQQNLNHYNPGWPGFLDVAWAQGFNQTSDDGFNVLFQIPDYWPHLQAQQTNFTTAILVPNVNCDHCTLRVRYHPNKPTEPIFHNCADISIVSSQSPLQLASWGNVIATVQQGPAFGVSNAQNELVTILPSGVAEPLIPRLGVRSATANVPYFQSQGLLASSAAMQSAYFIGGPQSQFTQNAAPSTLFSVPLKGEVVSLGTIPRPAALQQWSAMVATQNAAVPFILVGSQAVVEGNTYSYSIYYLYSNTTISPALIVTAPDDTFLNTFWVDYDSKNNLLYFLTGDENSLTALRVALYTFNLNTMTYNMVLVDNSKYTISAVHLNPSDSSLYAVSPGLFGQNGPWTLIRINASTGAVTAGPVIAPANQYLNNYWGAVYGPGVTVKGEILHVFQTPLGGLVLSGIDIQSGKFTFQTGLDTGLNGANTWTGFTYIPPK